MGDPFIEVTDLGFVYHRDTPQAVRALDGLSFAIRRGEYVGIVGGNGSGKSTLARHLNGLLIPTEGRVRVGGLDTRDPKDRWAIRRQVGMIFQNPDNQLVGTIVEEDVAFGPENLGLPPAEIRARVDDALAAVGLTALRRLEPHRLSGGQKQRLAVAGILAMRPDCVVLDEATTMLDPEGRADVLALVGDLHRAGITVVFISHALEDLTGADRILVLDEGRLVMDGRPAEVFERAEEVPGGRLQAPAVVQLARALRAGGLDLPVGLITVEALAAAVAAALGAGARHG